MESVEDPPLPLSRTEWQVGRLETLEGRHRSQVLKEGGFSKCESYVDYWYGSADLNIGCSSYAYLHASTVSVWRVLGI